MSSSLHGSRRRARGNDAGFTLLEVLLGAGILAVSVLVVSSVAAASQRLSLAMEQKDRALAALEEKVREIEATSFDQVIPLFHGTGFNVTADATLNNMLPPLAGDADGMPGSVTVVAANPPNDPNLLLQVTTRIDWNGPAGPQRLARTFLVSRPGQP